MGKRYCTDTYHQLAPARIATLHQQVLPIAPASIANRTSKKCQIAPSRSARLHPQEVPDRTYKNCRIAPHDH
jgi:hypothetical protein